MTEARRTEMTPLSAVELAEAEREAKHDSTTWAMRFKRLLALHRAVERQSAMLQSQVRLLESENAKLEAAYESKTDKGELPHAG